MAIQFIDSIQNNFRLNATSPVIDAGLDLSAYGVNFDFDNAPRPAGKAFDIGAFEYQITSDIKTVSDISSSVFLYPNPSNGTFKVNVLNINSFANRLVVYNVLGKEVMNLKLSQGETAVDMKNRVEKGVYFAEVNTGIERKKIKLIIK